MFTHLPLRLLFISSLSLSSFVLANDVYVRVNSPLTQPLTQVLPIAETGKSLYDTQEGVHATITETTGEEIEHDYIHGCVDDECVPVDPVRVRN